MEKWAEINRTYSEIWPVITEIKEPPSDTKEWENVENKFEQYFSKKPGK
jgi:ferredoxin